jgi:hypothetical protein
LEAAEESTGVMRQPEEEEEPDVQMQPEEEEEPEVQAQSEPEEEEEEPIRTKSELSFGAPGDRYEREADAVADRVMAMPEPGVQRQELEEEEPPEVQAQVEEEEEPEVQAKGETTPVVTPAMKSELNVTRGAGAPLPRDVRAFMEPRFGRDFSGVRVHTGSRAASLAKELRAQAFTRGSDIYFASEKYAPATAAGKRLVAHELAHTVRQERTKNGLQKTAVVRRKVDPKKVNCARLTRTTLGKWLLKKLIGTTDPVGEIQAADREAIKMLDAVMKELDRCQKMWRRSGYLVLSPKLDVFTPLWKAGINPRDIKAWISRRYLTRKGEPTVALLIERLGRVRRILNGGRIRYTCLGRICHKQRKGTMAYVYRKYRIYFCKPFWVKIKAADVRGIYLIHEVFHICCRGTDQPTGISSAYGIAGFVADSYGVKLTGKRP